MVGGLIAALIPQLTKFGGGMLKGILSQLIYWGGDPSYKQNLLAKFIPRVLSQTSLGNSQTEQIINQHLQSRNYQSVLQTIQSAEQGLDKRNFVPDEFKMAFNQNENSPQLVQAVRKVFHSLVETMDTLMTQRLSTSGNLLSSLLTSLIENLRLELEDFEKTHSQEVKRLSAILEQIKAGLKDCGPPNNTGIFAILSAILVCIVLIFPGLFILKNSLTAFMRKLQSTQQASMMRKVQRENYARTIQGHQSDRDTSPILARRSQEEPDNSLHWPEANTLEMPRQIRSRPVVLKRRGSYRAESGHAVRQERQDNYNDAYLNDHRAVLTGSLKDNFIPPPPRTQAPPTEPRSRKNLASSFIKEDSM